MLELLFWMNFYKCGWQFALLASKQELTSVQEENVSPGPRLWSENRRKKG